MILDPFDQLPRGVLEENCQKKKPCHLTGLNWRATLQLTGLASNEAFQDLPGPARVEAMMHLALMGAVEALVVVVGGQFGWLTIGRADNSQFDKSFSV